MPRARNRVCSQPGCPAMQPATRCPTHQRAEDQHRRTTTPTKATRTRTEQQRRAHTVDEHRNTFGDWCPGWRVPAHQTADLTADHVTEINRGGDPHGPLTVLCRGCNARKANTRQASDLH